MHDFAHMHLCVHKSEASDLEVGLVNLYAGPLCALTIRWYFPGKASQF